ncbi:MAG: hypothetical protein KKB51_15800 [Candidatus Riflebacteria bacterium]|nr:hypothetical protein [Candidatus Riflebacteria bacterium]
MSNNDAKAKDSMNLVFFKSPNQPGKISELLKAVDSFQGAFDVFLCPWNEAERKDSQATLIDFESCIVEFSAVADAVGLIASNLINDRFIPKKSVADDERIHSYSRLLIGLQLQMKAIEAKYSGLELAQLVCARPQESDNQVAAL